MKTTGQNIMEMRMLHLKTPTLTVTVVLSGRGTAASTLNSRLALQAFLEANALAI